MRQPFPVNVVFEFQTKGVANPRATKLLKEQVLEEIKASGLFSEISDSGTQKNAKLMISINNIVLTDDAVQQGFMTGLTFGAVGSSVSDGYVCTITYFPENASEPIIKKTTHAIHTTLGAKTAPVAVEREPSLEAGVRKMTKEIIHGALYELSIDERFSQ